MCALLLFVESNDTHISNNTVVTTAHIHRDDLHTIVSVLFDFPCLHVT